MCVFYCVRTHIFFQCFLNESQDTFLYGFFHLHIYIDMHIAATIYISIVTKISISSSTWYIVFLDEKCLTDILTKLVCDGFNCGNNLIKEVCLFS